MSEEEMNQFLEQWAESGEWDMYRQSPMYTVLQRCTEVALRSQAPAIEDWELEGWGDSSADEHGRVKYYIYVYGWSKKELSMRLA
jgi:hypothetical protein